MPADRSILVVTSSSDMTATYLCDRLSRDGIPFVRFNTESFPGSRTFHWAVHPNTPATLASPEGVIDTGRIDAVWYRRPAAPTISTEVSEPAAREFALRECEQTLAALWQHLDVRWVNHPAKIRYASRKPGQLQLAADLGFDVPETILSADAGQVRSFWQRHNGAVVFKALHQDAIEISGRNYFAYASRLNVEHLGELEGLSLAPALFQQHVRPKLEIRATVIGEIVFAAAIDTSTSDEPDWRRLPPDCQRWEPYALPPWIEDRCRHLVRVYDLHFGALDLILTADGKYFFLELNANGQWVWIELITGMDMSAEMINLLAHGMWQT